jgi:hypothetical protein
MVKDLRHFMLSPPPLASLAYHQRRRIDHTVLQPTQQSALADGQQPRHCRIR